MGRPLAISRERVREIEAQALRKLRAVKQWSRLRGFADPMQ